MTKNTILLFILNLSFFTIAVPENPHFIPGTIQINCRKAMPVIVLLTGATLVFGALTARRTFLYIKNKFQNHLKQNFFKIKTDSHSHKELEKFFSNKNNARSIISQINRHP